jgi:uncharacterized protein YdhG (YjbR/CyaY superfamily)
VMDAFIAAFPPETQVALQRVRDIIRATAPGATETISYGIPTEDLIRRMVAFRVAEVEAEDRPRRPSAGDPAG